MTKEQAEFLVECCEYVGQKCMLYSDYSGRGMFGKKTHAIVVDRLSSLLEAVVRRMKSMREHELRQVPEMDDFRQDSLGYDVVVY